MTIPLLVDYVFYYVLLTTTSIWLILLYLFCAKKYLAEYIEKENIPLNIINAITKKNINNIL